MIHRRNQRQVHACTNNDPFSSSDTGSLARRLREDAGLGVRALADDLGVTHSAVARAERGDPALVSLAERAVEHLLERHTGRPVAASLERGGGGTGAVLGVRRSAQRRTSNGCSTSSGVGAGPSSAASSRSTGSRSRAEGATATVRARSGDDELVLRFDLDRGVIEVGGRRFRPIVTSPYERADRESWGEALELLAAVYAPKPNAGWAKLERGRGVHAAHAGPSTRRRVRWGQHRLT